MTLRLSLEPGIDTVILRGRSPIGLFLNFRSNLTQARQLREVATGKVAQLVRAAVYTFETAGQWFESILFHKVMFRRFQRAFQFVVKRREMVVPIKRI